jgi:hypothetical protein
MAVFSGPEIVNDGLVLHLDAANLRSYSGSGTTWTDLSGNGNNGTLTNGPTFSTTNNGNINFDGVNDYVRINSFNPISTEFTVSTFIYPTITTGGTDRDRFGGTVFSQDPTNTSSRYPFWFRIRGTEISYSIWDNTADGITTTGANILSNKWHYIGIVAKKNGILKIFHNNFLLINSTCPNSGTWSGNFYLGDLRANRNILFGGSISNVILYNRLLDDAEIQQNFEATRGRYGI